MFLIWSIFRLMKAILVFRVPAWQLHMLLLLLVFLALPALGWQASYGKRFLGVTHLTSEQRVQLARSVLAAFEVKAC